MMYFAFTVFVTCAVQAKRQRPQALSLFLELSIASTKQWDQISSPECPKSVSSHACCGRWRAWSVSKGLEVLQRAVPYQPDPLQANTMCWHNTEVSIPNMENRFNHHFNIQKEKKKEAWSWETRAARKQLLVYSPPLFKWIWTYTTLLYVVLVWFLYV